MENNSILEPRLLLSAYPLTRGIIERIETGQKDAETRALCLGELKKNSPKAIFNVLQKLGSSNLELWVVISDHNYQPYLHIMLLLASLVPAKRYYVVDYYGEGYEVNRLKIWMTVPWRLLWGSINGAWALRQADVATRRLMGAERLENHGSGVCSVAYLKTNLWFGVQAGGSIGHVTGVVNGFSRTGSKIDTYTAESSPLLDDDVGVFHIPIRASGGIPLEINGYIFQREFDRFVTVCCQKNSEIDLVYQRNCLVNYSGVLLSRQLKVPLVIEYNGSEVWIAKHWGTPLRFSALAERIEEVNLRHAHLIVVVSDVLKDELLERGIEAERILAYPNCIDPTIFDPDRFSRQRLLALRSQWNIPADALVCGFVGTFGPWHGVDVLARVVRMLVQEMPHWLQQSKIHFLFVGDGQLMPKVRELLSDMPKGLYTFTGLVPQTDAPAYLAMSDILLSPHVPNADGSRFFGSPTKLFEYMAMGKPIIASELEQIGQVLQGAWHVGRQGGPCSLDDLEQSAALLTKPGEVKEVVDALVYLAENSESCKALGDRARSLALTRYTWEQQVREIKNRLHSLEGRCA
ncbi:glycosyltransferase family 4 protein [Microvirgula aerodenitrificans]|uniref:glycosyltransferase family 4 protein n=1 Tax=Microvirgula aerodenitrificans TaxID=57480 RepID=UPI002F42B531